MQIKPCNLYQSAQEQLKRAEEVKKVKEVKKEEPEDWQSVSFLFFLFCLFFFRKLRMALNLKCVAIDTAVYFILHTYRYVPTKFR